MAIDPEMEKCQWCGGTGWDSAAKRTGTENMHPLHQPIGVWPCAFCRGTGECTLNRLQEIFGDIDFTKIMDAVPELRPVLKITLEGGSTYYASPEDLRMGIEGDIDGARPGQKWTLELTYMTHEQYSKLGDFEGH